jgi:hypothetical protein
MKELVFDQIVQFHVEIKLQGARHQMPFNTIAWTFCMKVDKKYLKHYTHWERWKSCKNICPNFKVLSHILLWLKLVCTLPQQHSLTWYMTKLVAITS